MFEKSNRPRVGPKENELMKGATADNSGRNEMRVLHITKNSRPSKSMCPSEKSQFIEMSISISCGKIKSVIREFKQFLKERDLYYYVSDLIDGHIGVLRCVGNAYFISSCVVCSPCFYQLLSFRDCS